MDAWNIHRPKEYTSMLFSGNTQVEDDALTVYTRMMYLCLFHFTLLSIRIILQLLSKKLKPHVYLMANIVCKMRMPDNDLTSIRARAPSQYPKRRLSVRSRKVSKPRDLYLELSDRSEIWQALRQQCCRCACQISKRYDNLKYQSRGFETLRDLTKRRLFGYWDGALNIFQPFVQVYLNLFSIYPHAS